MRQGLEAIFSDNFILDSYGQAKCLIFRFLTL